jgi:hypothetical protein
MTNEEFKKAPKEVKIIFNRVTSNEELKEFLDMATSLLNVESCSCGGNLGVMDHGVQKSIGAVIITLAS